MGHADFGAVPGVKPFVGGVLGGGSLPLSGYVLGPLVLRAYAATPSFDRDARVSCGARGWGLHLSFLGV